MQTFSLFIHDANSSTPTLMMEIASDLERVQALAARALAESDHRLAVEVRQDDRLVFSLDRNGVVWSAGRSRHATVGVIQGANGKYVRTYAEGVWNDNLLALPECA